ncbi:hypothetical protein ACIOEX_10185 [Streptomyces sp. NPDC087850]|uniref:hypothetical protein n=1 Tax=Streptomyces sp. NPDC087850 TaxID=3365809 RepID=UPI0037F267FA
MATLAALVLIPVAAVTGGDAFRAFIDFGAGVLSLLSLSGAVVWGLIATDRLLLAPRQRLIAQGIHRATAVASVGFLLLHVSIKISLGKVALIGALLPFGLGITGTSGLIGFGSLGGLLMIVAATTGAARSVFSLPGKYAYKWRAMHMLAYPAWCFAMVHGLFTGRPAATYVTVMYSVVMVGVAGVVSLRLLPRESQSRIAEGIVAVLGSAGDKRAAREAPRDLFSMPGGSIPGGGTMPMQREYQPRPQREQPAQSPIEAPRKPQPRLPAPSPQLYEATRPMADPMAETFVAPRGGDAFAGFGSEGLQESGTGLSAGYRAMSQSGGADATARMPMPPQQQQQSPPNADIPLAERVLMTDEIPVIQDAPTGRGGWGAPMPPPPGEAAFTQPSQAQPVPYNTGAVPQQYDTGATPQYPGAAAAQPPAFDPGAMGGNQPYDRGRPPPYDPDAPQYDTGSIPTYNTGATPQFNPGAPASPYGPDGASPYGTTGPAPSYDTGSLPPYNAGAASPYTTGAVPAYDARAYGGQAPATPDPYAQPPASNGNPANNPLYPPPAGEPWNAPAGERP